MLIKLFNRRTTYFITINVCVPIPNIYIYILYIFRKIIVDGLFGIANDENINEINTVSSGQSDEIQMEVEYDTKIDHDKW